MRRKKAKLASLLAYIDHSAMDEVPFYWNILSVSGKGNPRQAFEQQLRQLKQRQRGNCLYHEILSLKKTLPVKQLKNILYYLLIRYLQERAPQLVGYARLHEEPHHLHLHLVLSANPIGKARPLRLSKERFREIKRELEQELQLLFPELEKTEPDNTFEIER